MYSHDEGKWMVVRWAGGGRGECGVRPACGRRSRQQRPGAWGHHRHAGTFHSLDIFSSFFPVNPLKLIIRGCMQTSMFEFKVRTFRYQKLVTFGLLERLSDLKDAY